MRNAILCLLAAVSLTWAFAVPVAAADQTERWSVVATQGLASVPVPRSHLTVVVPAGTSPFPFQKWPTTTGTYKISGYELFTFIRSASGEYVKPLPGTYSLRRSSQSYSLETFTMDGPMAALGVGSTSDPHRATVTFSPRPGVKVIFARTLVPEPYQPLNLWTSTTAYVVTRNIVITPEAVDELAVVIGDADDALEADSASAAEYDYVRFGAEQLVDGAVQFAREDGSAAVTREHVDRAKKKLCPVFPFCKKPR